MTYDDLHQAWLAYRRKHGSDAASKILRDFGPGGLDSVPDQKWPNLLAVLTADIALRSQPAPKAVTDLDTTAIFDRWNTQWRRPDRRQL